MIGSHGSICQKSMKQNIFQINFLNVLCPQITAKETTVKVKYLRNIFLSFHTRLQGIGKLSKFMDWTFVKIRECYPCNLWEEISFPWIQIFRSDILVDWHLEREEDALGTLSFTRNMKWALVNISWYLHFFLHHYI